MSRALKRFLRTNAPLPVLGTNNVFLVTMSGTVDGELWINNLAYMGINTLTSASESNIASSFYTAVKTAWQNVNDITSGFSTVKVTCVNLPARIPFVLQVNSGVAVTGSIGNTHLPKEMAAITSKYTSTKGQHGRGRNYWAGIPTTFTTPLTDPNELNSVGITAYNALLTAIQSTAIVDGAVVMSLCVYTRTLKGLAVTNAQTVATSLVRTVLGTVRRRRPGRGS